MNRRAFFHKTIGLFVAAAAAPLALRDVLPLMFHPFAFAFVMEDVSLDDFRERYLRPAAEHMARGVERSILDLHVGQP